MPRKAIDMSGFISGRLKVIEKVGCYQKQAMWSCECSCGNIITVAGANLRSGRTKSCGCLAKELMTTHGMYKTNTYSSWKHMKVRCDSENFHQFKDYGGRGIAYDPSWSNFENFYMDMGDCPDGYTLDRLDVNGNYCKENCKWSSRQEQSVRQRLSKRNKSGRSGVTETKNGRWQVRIVVNYKKITLGTFDSFEEACAVKSEAELKYFGMTKE
jgi:hypothetical protein